MNFYALYDLVPWDEPLLIGVSLLLPEHIAARVNPHQALKDAG